jgi:HD-GYP domain-containing protein (c-di-GMP phosphodiesterase class II)
MPDLSKASATVVLQHVGPPQGATRRGIHSFCRIVAVVDVYEALAANHVYCDADLPHHAFELLLDGGTQFDPQVIEAFSSTIAIYPVGMTLLYRAVVVRSPRK